MRMSKVRSVTVAGFASDPDPNVTAPPDSQVFDVATAGMGDQTGAERDIEGVRFAVRFVTGASPPVDVPDATADFTCWFLDEGATAAYGRQVWNRYTPETGALHAALFSAPIKGKMYVQLTALGSVGAATKAEVWVVAASSVMG